jgi:hypothetical protein
MSYLCYLCLLVYSGIFVLLFFVLCTVPYVASFAGLSFYDIPFDIIERLFTTKVLIMQNVKLSTIHFTLKKLNLFVSLMHVGVFI